MRKDDPYYDRKVYHLAAKISNHGEVSALCYKRPRAINLARGQSWVTDASRVTCQKCKRLAKDRGIANAFVCPTNSDAAGGAHG